MIFNTDSNCSEIWDGTNWISNGSGPITSAVINGPTAGRASYPIFSYQTLQLTAEGYGGTAASTYSWYVDNLSVSGANSQTFTFDPAAFSPSTGEHTIYCLVANTLGFAVSNVITAIVQDGVQGELTGIKFKDKDDVEHIVAMQFLGQENATEGGYPGDLYQYGRAADGYEKINSPAVTKQATSVTRPYQSADGESLEGKFIAVNPWSSDPLLSQNWNGTNSLGNPCLSGWHVPSWTEFCALFPLDVLGGTGGKSLLTYDRDKKIFKWCNDSDDCVVIPLALFRDESGVPVASGVGDVTFARAWTNTHLWALRVSPDGKFNIGLNATDKYMRAYPILCFGD
jgi:hypothetical protein